MQSVTKDALYKSCFWTLSFVNWRCFISFYIHERHGHFTAFHDATVFSCIICWSLRNSRFVHRFSTVCLHPPGLHGGLQISFRRSSTRTHTCGMVCGRRRYASGASIRSPTDVLRCAHVTCMMFLADHHNLEITDFIVDSRPPDTNVHTHKEWPAAFTRLSGHSQKAAPRPLVVVCLWVMRPKAW